MSELQYYRFDRPFPYEYECSVGTEQYGTGTVASSLGGWKPMCPKAKNPNYCTVPVPYVPVPVQVHTVPCGTVPVPYGTQYCTSSKPSCTFVSTYVCTQFSFSSKLTISTENCTVRAHHANLTTSLFLNFIAWRRKTVRTVRCFLVY